MKHNIETQRLLIRPIQDNDLEGIYKLDSDIRVQEFLGKKPLENKTQAAQMISFITKQYKDFGIGRWAVIEKQTNTFIGWTGFKYINNGVNGVEEYLDFGYRFVYDAWGKGYATEAALACLIYADKYLTLLPIHAISEVGNKGSKNVLEKAGFKAVNTFLYENVPHFWYIRLNK
ncbi:MULTISPECIES: GNAT family N-acetyltransferase [Myroides]|uniref:GNAT family N-acetyltransferase n=1 Tax=Myroides albus TaxID=2562892 RepID=A0A6I3LI75_9FLAO|nr:MULTISPECIES: GNAT family N-acetyltransferase [Myroides]MTG98238.1 GNAT family N-acetyltransferase [Myroides albus]MVX35011.1 GNAT family N-acetyltransferase [Myroides sp. LoEW2-1]UVD79035.1 GNAT family N-acetyltransferase [Myroides albus]